MRSPASSWRACARASAAQPPTSEVKVVVLTGAGPRVLGRVRHLRGGRERDPERRSLARPALDRRLARHGAVVAAAPDHRRGARLVPGRSLRARDGVRHDRGGRRRPFRRAGDPLRVGAGLAADAVRARPEEDQRVALHRRLGGRDGGRATRARQPRRAPGRPRGRGGRAGCEDRPDTAARAATDETRAQPGVRGDGAAPGGQRQPRLSAILNAAETPEQREFDSIVAARGLKAALAWRDSRYGSP